MSKIELTEVDLVYRVYKEKKLKDLLFRPRYVPEGLISSRIHALKKIDLMLREGDRLGVIGHNGAGKSSLLKVIAGIYPHTSGRLEVEGRTASLFELATGFEMEASGWENIYLRGLMLGESPRELKSKIEEIAEFSELGEYLNVPVKYYSSGMFVRLAFSVSTAIEPDILLLDEVVGAGDAKFLNKARQRIDQLVSKVKVLVFVTHNMSSLLDFCNACIWLENGEIRMTGPPETVSAAYLEDSKQMTQDSIQG